MEYKKGPVSGARMDEEQPQPRDILSSVNSSLFHLETYSKKNFFLFIKMQYSSFLCLFLGLQAVTAAAVDTVQPLSEGIEGDSIEPIVWEVPVFPGGENATIAGTVEEVHAELMRRNPQWDDDFPLEVAASDDLATGGLERRNDFRGTPIVCGPGTFRRGKASTYEINRGITHLRGVSGRPSRGPGPGNCGRVSCSWNSAIWWCNDVRTLLPSPFPSLFFWAVPVGRTLGGEHSLEQQRVDMPCFGASRPESPNPSTMALVTSPMVPDTSWIRATTETLLAARWARLSTRLNGTLSCARTTARRTSHGDGCTLYGRRAAIGIQC